MGEAITMDSFLIAAIISAVITVLGVGVAYFQWRKDVQIKLESLREEATIELIKQRSGIYKEFFVNLEQMSTVHRVEIESNPSIARKFVDVFQDAIYSPVGLFASSDTREMMVYARLGCKLYSEGSITYDQWLQRIWAVHYALRSDLGISQPNWSSEVERIRENVIAQSSQSIAKQVESTRHLRYDDTQMGQKTNSGSQPNS